MRFRVKQPATSSAAYKLYLKTQSKALVLGPSALRRYPSANGPLDAECVDAAMDAIVALVRKGALSPGDASPLYKSVASQYWQAGQFARAHHFAELAMVGANQAVRTQIAEICRYCKAGLYPVDVLWMTDEEPSPDRDRVRQALAGAQLRKPKDSDTQLVASETIRGTHAPLLDLPHSVGFSEQTPLGVVISAGSDLNAIWTAEPLPLKQLVSEDYPSRDIPRLSFDAPFLIAAPDVFSVLAEHLPEDSCIQRARLDNELELFVVQLAECDCIVSSSSSTIRRKSGRMEVWRGMFDMAAVGERKLFRPRGTFDIFVAPSFAKRLKALLRKNGIREARLLDDVADRI